MVRICHFLLLWSDISVDLCLYCGQGTSVSVVVAAEIGCYF